MRMIKLHAYMGETPQTHESHYLLMLRGNFREFRHARKILSRMGQKFEVTQDPSGHLRRWKRIHFNSQADYEKHRRADLEIIFGCMTYVWGFRIFMEPHEVDQPHMVAYKDLLMLLKLYQK
jgi:hypothetical protein